MFVRNVDEAKPSIKISMQDSMDHPRSIFVYSWIGIDKGLYVVVMYFHAIMRK